MEMHAIDCIAIHHVDDGDKCTEVGLYNCIVCYIRRTIVTCHQR
jgi:hypothetical protein